MVTYPHKSENMAVIDSKTARRAIEHKRKRRAMPKLRLILITLLSMVESIFWSSDDHNGLLCWPDYRSVKGLAIQHLSKLQGLTQCLARQFTCIALVKTLSPNVPVKQKNKSLIL